jgi:hypothetical protein
VQRTVLARVVGPRDDDVVALAREGDRRPTDANLRALANAAGQELTYTCVPPGSGQRAGIDRDENGTLDGDELGLGAECGFAPASGCKLSTKSLLHIKTSGGKEKLNWKWIKGADTTLAELGDPVTAGETDYSLCVFSGTSSDLIMEVNVAAGGGLWKATGTTGFKYKDSTFGQDGAQRIVLKAGVTDKAKAIVKGKGSMLPLPTIPPTGLEYPVTVQLKNSDNECWEAEYDGPDEIKNEPAEFKAKF